MSATNLNALAIAKRGILICTALTAGSGAALAAMMDDIVSIGTRSDDRVVAESTVPVDVLNDEAMTSTGETEVGRILQRLAPSFNFSSSTISDGTDALRPATLRGLGPDQTLVLVNGKRRHGSALIHVNTSVGRGTAGTDLNAIPASAIKRIEVLRDGAAAQYGSDAIAGVINLVLKDDDGGGRISGSYGGYTEGDGETYLVNFNKGFTIGDGYLNLNAEYRNRGRTNRAGLSGQCQFVCTPGPLGQVSTDPREAIFDRQNFRIGDADSDQVALTLNLGIPFGDNMEFYGFATYSDRENTSGGFYRRANQANLNPSELFDGTVLFGGDAFYPNGTLPKINTDINDLSFNAGLRGEAYGWDWDLGVGWAENDFGFFITDSLNASLVSAVGSSPTSADSGSLVLGLVTVDLDLVRDTSWGNLAFGIGLREDSYEINAGELVSYADFDTINGVNLGINNASGGIQVFPGFSPDNAVDEDRDAISVYIDAEYDQWDGVLIGGAVRFEDYSDFGSTFNAKITGAFDVNDEFRVRGALSSGFRAPSLQQQFFNNTSTQFNAGVAEQTGTFRNDSEVAKAIGIPKLEEETSINFSAGVVIQPTDSTSITIDYYRIDIEDRIVISGEIESGLPGAAALDAALAAAGADTAQFFLNGVDTETQGVDIVVSHDRPFAGGDLNITLAANITETEIDSVRAPDALSSIPGIQDVIFTSQDRSIIEEWQPEDRVNLTGNFVKNDWTFTLGVNRYGEYTVEESNGDRQTFDAKYLVDTQFSYDFGNGLVLRAGGNNIFDETPDENMIGQTRTGTIVDGADNVIVSSPGVFVFNRRSAPFGFNGAYWYVGGDFSF